MPDDKIIAILPAYQAEKTIQSFVRSLPVGVFDEIILVDDASPDHTYEKATRMTGVTVYRNTRNVGYGGNLKQCLGRALDHGAHIIVELHPDGEYATDGIEPAIEKVRAGADLVLGNRFANHPKGMYWSKIWVTRILTALDNAILGTSIADMHQGFRVYTRKFLQTVDYKTYNDDFLFSFEMIVSAVANGISIATVPVSTQYSGTKRGASWRASIRYTLQTFSVLFAYWAGCYRRTFTKKRLCPSCGQWYATWCRYTVGKCSLWYCNVCKVGFTFPAPENMKRYYPRTYWDTPGMLGWFKDRIFAFAQQRRVRWVVSRIATGDVLDVGAGKGLFGRALRAYEFRVTDIDPWITQVASTWPLRKRFDAITFWESLEHVPDPKAYLKKAHAFLKSGGYLFVEYPRFGGLESRVYGKHWFHLDMPRHLFHFTDAGLAQLIENAGFSVLDQTSIWALDYAPWGLVRSVALFPFGVLIACMLYLLGASPIGLVIAKKL